MVEHGDLVATNLLKRDAVVEYLGERGVGLDEPSLRGHIAPRVIFMNPNLVLEPAIEALPEVVSRRELDEYLGSRPEGNWTERLFASLVEYLLDFESRPTATSPREPSSPIPPDQYDRIVTSLSEAGTWDRLHLYGTEVVIGDVIGLRLGPRSYRRPEVVETAGHLPVRIEWSRGRLVGFLKAVTGLGSLGSVYLGKTRREARPADTVTFHVVGEKEPSTFALVEIAQIVL
ncbi:MAG: NERD domain-containing protein, partial [Singulisphaera sp.]